MKYQVTITATAVKLLTVEADNETEAERLARQEAPGVRAEYTDAVVSVVRIGEKKA